MRLEIDADTSLWLPLPSTFPTPAGETRQEWEDGVLARMRPAWEGALTPEMEPIVRGALQHGLASVLPEDSVTLQFWPGPSIVNAVVHVGAGQWPDGERATGLPLDEEVLRHGVLTEPFASPALGAGAQVTFYFEAPTEPRTLLAGAGFFFNSPSGYVAVTSEPTIPPIFSALIPHLTALVDRIEVHGATWLPAEPLPMVSGEEWPDFNPLT
jgi:hypothetical protein